MRSQLCTLFGIVIVLAVVMVACEDDPAAVPRGEALISGVIRDAVSQQPLEGVIVEARIGGSLVGTSTTGVSGAYEVRFSLDTTATVTMNAGQKSGYRDTIVVVSLSSGQSIQVNIPLATLSPVTGGSGTGIAQTIAFISAVPREVAVFGVGGNETSVIGFEVRDSLGFPIDAAHAVQMTFTILPGLNGGEYVSPVTVTTNAQGRAYTTFNAGIRSGAVQVEARVTLPGRPPIVSSPVRIVIHAGYPEANHFSIATARGNFPALGYVGRTTAISVLVGDVYGNPVQPNTAVYLTSRAGVIQASVFTNAFGSGTVNLISGNPPPFGVYSAPVFGDGYHYVVASTVGQGGQPIVDSLLMLWTGPAMISNVSPQTFNLPNMGSQTFTFRVSDALGHPLSSGTSIRVTASVPPPPSPDFPVNQVHIGFGIDGVVTLEDVLFPGPGTTDFSFLLRDGTAQIDTLTAVTVAIAVTSPANANGTAYHTIDGYVR